MGGVYEKKVEPTVAVPVGKLKKYRLLIDQTIEAISVAKARETARELLGEMSKDLAVLTLIPKPRHPSRSERLEEAQAKIGDAKDIVEELKDEIEQWRDSVPENLQGGERYSQLEECEDALDNMVNSLDEAESAAGDVSFPGMFG